MKSPHVILKNLQTILRERGAITNTFLMSLVFMLALGAAAPAQLASADRALQSVIGNSQPDVQPAAMNPASEGQQVPDEIANVPGVTEDWWAAVQEQIRQDMYDLSSGAGRDGIPSHQGYNLAHNLDLTFTSGGVRVTPGQPAPDPAGDELRDPVPAADQQPTGADEEEQWEWSLLFTGYGYVSALLSPGEGNVQLVSAPAEMTADGNRVEYRRDGITESYINDDRGLKQGFTIDAPPSPGPAQEGEGEGLILEMFLEETARPTGTGCATRNT